MSIYGSFFGIEDEREWIADLKADGIDGGVIRDGDPAPEDLDAPYVYQGSHILPELDHPRGGSIDLAHIAAHVRFWRDNPDAPPEQEPYEPLEPFLRLSVHEHRAANRHAALLLTPRQARRMAAALTDWADQTEATA